MSLNISKINANLGLKNFGNVPVQNNFSVKKAFEFGAANPNRPEQRSWFTQNELCGANVNGAKLYLLA